MATPTYSHAQRILTCERCGAPLSAAVEGGRFTCEFCQAVNVVSARDESVDLSTASSEPAISEAERYARLREQDCILALPPSLKPYVEGSSIVDVRVDEALSDWKKTRAGLSSAGTSFPVLERLYYLTVLLAPRLDDHNRRALLETAAELLTDPGHRHVVRCLLAREAARTGDVEAARAWLAPCNSRPTDLQMDSAYRLAAATIATAQRDFAGVRAVLGERSGDVPIYDLFEWECAILRVNAREELGDLEGAAVEVLGWLERWEEAATRAFVSQHAPLTLIPRALPEALRRAAQMRAEALRRAAQRRAADASERIGALETQIRELESQRVSQGIAAGCAAVAFIALILVGPLGVLGVALAIDELGWPEGPAVLAGVGVALVCLGLVFAWGYRSDVGKRQIKIDDLEVQIAELRRGG